MKLKRILAFIFPKRCQYCRKVINYNEVICKECLKNIKRKVYIKEIKINEEKTVQVVSPFIYEKEIRKAICAFKFNGKVELSENLAESMALSIKEKFNVSEIDFITSVPMTEKSYQKRGYNQAEILARHVAKKLDLPYIEVLCKIKENKKQHTLSMNDRKENIRGVYSIIDKNLVKGKNILICDDIVTTGSTLAECMKLLLNSGTNNIHGATIAKAIFVEINKYPKKKQ